MMMIKMILLILIVYKQLITLLAPSFICNAHLSSLTQQTFLYFSGQYQVICSPETVVAFPGDDVILSCRVQPRLNVTGFALEWSKPELQSDPNDPLSQKEYVHICRDSKEFLDMKTPSYVGRTSILEEDLRDGIISLKIANVTLADGGKYKCLIPKLDSQNRSAVVYLVISELFCSCSR